MMISAVEKVIRSMCSLSLSLAVTMSHPLDIDTNLKLNGIESTCDLLIIFVLDWAGVSLTGGKQA